MELAEFGVNVLGRRALEAVAAGSPSAGRRCTLLADVLSAAAEECSTQDVAEPSANVLVDEWLAVWSDAALQLFLNPRTPVYGKEKIEGAVLAFVTHQAGGGNRKAIDAFLATLEAAEATGHARKSVLGLQTRILCIGSAVTAFLPTGYTAALLAELCGVEDEDWVSSQMHALCKNVDGFEGDTIDKACADGRNKAGVWEALEKKGGGSQGAAVSALRLAEIYGEQRVSEEFMVQSLGNRTRGTRRLTVEMMRQRYGTAAWWSVWESAFLVISDEQPWHLVQPAWLDVIAIGGLFTSKIPDTWGKALILRASCHSDHRVVRRTTQDVIDNAGALPESTVSAILPAALHVNADVRAIPVSLLPALLTTMLTTATTPSVTAANALQAIDYASLTFASAEEKKLFFAGVMAQVRGVSALWRDCGATKAHLSPLATAAVRVAGCFFEKARDESAQAATVASDVCIVFEHSRASVEDVQEGLAANGAASVDLSAVVRSLLAVAWVSDDAGRPRLNGAFSQAPGASAKLASTSLLYYTAFELSPSVASDALTAHHAPCFGETASGDERMQVEVFKAAVEKEVSLGVEGQGHEAGAVLTVAGLAFGSDLACGLCAPASPEDDQRAVSCLLQTERYPALSAAVAAMVLPNLASHTRPTVTLAMSIPASHWTSQALAACAGPLLSWVCEASASAHVADRLSLSLKLLTDATMPAISAWVCDVVLPSLRSGTGGAPTKKKAKKSGVPQGIREVMEAVEQVVKRKGCTGKEEDVLTASWALLRQYPVKFSGSRHAYGAFFRAVVSLDGARGPTLLHSLEALLDEVICQSSIVASQLTAACLCTVDDVRVLSRLALYSPAPKAQALDPHHPAVVIAKCHGPNSKRRVDVSAFCKEVVCEVQKDAAQEGHDGSAAQLRRVRQWWLLCALVPQVSVEAVEAVAAAAVEELRHARVVPRTRVLVQNAWALCCALHPSSSSGLPLLISTLLNPATETRLAVSSIITSAHLLLSKVDIKPASLMTDLLSAVVGWTMAMPHAARTHAQLVLAEYLEAANAGRTTAIATDEGASPFLKPVQAFLSENPHVKVLRTTAGMDRLVSLYLGAAEKGQPGVVALPAFSPHSVEMKVLKAMRLVQNRFSELDSQAGGEKAAPAAGWASKGSRKCPARARGGGACGAAPADADDDESSDDDAEEEGEADAQALVDPTHQRRPTPGRPPKSGHARICVVGTFLDNLPNQAGLCRTLEALFGTAAELTLPSLKATQEPAFLRMSMASERWLKIIEIPPGERLAAYLERKRLEGFRIVALEQTDNSVPAPQYTFEKDTVIIIGNEQLGCPAWLLRRPELVHDFVELPLDGASRSLNAHVTASAMLWQYRMQTY